MLSPRKHRISRLEEFSDAVFGFALTLLVLSTTVPRSYAQLIDLLRDLPAFACCFALLVWIWHEHDAFFERHAIHDAPTILLNSALLFVVLVYVYPLKFMFEAFMAQFGLGRRIEAVEKMSFTELANASVLYGLGFFILMTLFALLYFHAYRRRHQLELSPLEAFESRSIGGHHVVSASVGLLAMLLALVLPRQLAFLSPMSFALMGPAHYVFGRVQSRKRQAFLARASAPAVSVVRT